MSYKPIEVDRKNLTIMGVPFPDLTALESAANAIGSNMFEGFEPTAKSITIIRDYMTDTRGRLISGALAYRKNIPGKNSILFPVRRGLPYRAAPVI
jgi:putative transcriptional regulator